MCVNCSYHEWFYGHLACMFVNTITESLMGLSPDTQNCGLCKRREYQEYFPRHRTCATPGSLTSGFLWSRCRGKRSRHSQSMHNPQICVSGKKPMVSLQCIHGTTSSLTVALVISQYSSSSTEAIKLYFNHYLHGAPFTFINPSMDKQLPAL